VHICQTWKKKADCRGLAGKPVAINLRMVSGLFQPVMHKVRWMTPGISWSHWSVILSLLNNGMYNDFKGSDKHFKKEVLELVTCSREKYMIAKPCI
jgi:hypothetical protein